MKPYPREHGTDRGYQQHRHRGDMPACDPCKAAHVKRVGTYKRGKAGRCTECGQPVGHGRRRYCGEACNRVGKNRRERERNRRRYVPRPRVEPQPVEPAELPRVRWIRRGLVWVAQGEREAS